MLRLALNAHSLPGLKADDGKLLRALAEKRLRGAGQFPVVSITVGELRQDYENPGDDPVHQQTQREIAGLIRERRRRRKTVEAWAQAQDARGQERESGWDFETDVNDHEDNDSADTGGSPTSEADAGIEGLVYGSAAARAKVRREPERR